MESRTFRQFSTEMPLDYIAMEAGALVIRGIFGRDPALIREQDAYSQMSENCTSYAMMEDGLIVATGAINNTALSGVALLNLVAVHPNMQRQGLGRAMMNYLEDLAVLEKSTQALLAASSNAHGFYKKLGYEFVDSKPGKRTMFMRKDLCIPQRDY